MAAETNPLAGYDTTKVSSRLCLYCNVKIGDAAFIEVTTLAPFVQTLFAHKTCVAGTLK